MTYELAKQLKDAGFPQNPDNPQVHTAICGNFDNPDPECRSENRGVAPTLEELIEATDTDYYFSLENMPGGWIAQLGRLEEAHEVSGGYHPSPTEAVARLWLALNKK